MIKIIGYGNDGTTLTFGNYNGMKTTCVPCSIKAENQATVISKQTADQEGNTPKACSENALLVQIKQNVTNSTLLQLH